MTTTGSQVHIVLERGLREMTHALVTRSGQLAPREA